MNYKRPRLQSGRGVQVAMRMVVWFFGGMVLGLGLGLTALGRGLQLRAWTWWIGGPGFVGIELVVNLVMWMRGRACFYDGRG